MTFRSKALAYTSSCFDKKSFVKHEKASTALRFEGGIEYLNFVYAHVKIITWGIIFRITAVLWSFAHIRPTSVNWMWSKLPKAHPHAKTFHLHHSHVFMTIRYKETAWKISCFTWAYFQVSTTIRFKDTTWKRIDDGQTDTQNIYTTNLWGWGLITKSRFVKQF